MNRDLKNFAENIKDFKSAYLAGGIQKRPRPDQWRQDITQFLEKNNRKTNNPYADNEKIFNSSIMGYKEDETCFNLDELMDIDENKWAVLMKQTEDNDMYFISKSDIIIIYLDESAGFGTMTEFRENYNQFKKPLIIVRNISRRKLAHWIGWRRYFSLVRDKTAIEFKSLADMKRFFVEYLGFKE